MRAMTFSKIAAIFFIVVLGVCPTVSVFADTLTVAISSSSDDAEEMDSNGNVRLINPYLELVDDKGKKQSIGLRFIGITIPPGATILNAYIEFTASSIDVDSAEFVFNTEASANSAPILKESYNLSSRPLNSSTVIWSNIPPWNVVGEVYQSTNLSVIVQEVIDFPGWSSGSAITFIVTGHGVRTADLYERNPATAPRLIIEFSPVPDFVLLKSVQLLSDPFNGSSNPKAIPGAEMLYTITVTNYGTGPADLNTVFTTDPIPVNSDLFIGDLVGGGPIDFADGSTSSGMNYTFDNLNSVADDLEFSSDNGATFGYNATPDAFGFDPNITHFRINPKGAFNASINGSTPSYTIRFKVRVK